jgi:hypothetical protein
VHLLTSAGLQVWLLSPAPHPPSTVKGKAPHFSGALGLYQEGAPQ